jgi:hypothetical protein
MSFLKNFFEKLETKRNHKIIGWLGIFASLVHFIVQEPVNPIIHGLVVLGYGLVVLELSKYKK